DAAERARNGAGPTLLETKTYRFAGHSKSDTGGKYRPKEEIAAWQARDPLTSWRGFLLEHGVPDTLIAGLEAEIEQEVEAASQFALDSAYAEDEALSGAYAATSSSPAGRHAGTLAAAGIGGFA
ncbi:MAG TPA: thiamine pyrophosphate-dependent enzyme, partial [Thermomicrobiales bacterium]|nr:thiamine pyrophosphate-dependent enzyme [Thermomicrobiales bacterium]